MHPFCRLYLLHKKILTKTLLLKDIECDNEMISAESFNNYDDYNGTQVFRANQDQKLTTKQLKDYKLCMDRYNKAIEICTARTGDVMLAGIVATGLSASGGPITFLFSAGASIYAVHTTHKSCYRDAKISANHCLEDKNVPIKL